MKPTSLDLNWNYHIKSVGAIALAHVLNHLDLRGTSIPPDGIQALKQAKATCAHEMQLDL
jgi:hypothetical protein